MREVQKTNAKQRTITFWIGAAVAICVPLATHAKDPTRITYADARDYRRQIADRYDEALAATSHGQYARAESLYTDLIKNWSKGNYVPPLALIQLDFAKEQSTDEIDKLYRSAAEKASHGDYTEVEILLNHMHRNFRVRKDFPSLAELHLARAQTLKKIHREKEAKNIEMQWNAEALREEDQLKSSIKIRKTELEKLSPKTYEYSSVRIHLANARNRLALLYVAEGKYANAESLMKDAFVDAGTARGRQSTEALAIEHNYELLLAMMGRASDEAKRMIAITKFRPPITIALSASAKMIKNNADRLVITIEDQGWNVGTECNTKRAWLEGLKNDAAIWRIAIPLHTSVDMNGTLTAEANDNTFTVCSFAPGMTGKLCQQFTWNGNKVTYRTSFYRSR